MTIGDIVISRYVILLFVIFCIGLLLYIWGFFKFTKNIVFDCLMEHSTGRYTINNLARFLTLFTFSFLLIITHVEVHIKPQFKILTVPFSEWEMAIILTFIVSAEAVKKIKNPLQ